MIGGYKAEGAEERREEEKEQRGGDHGERIKKKKKKGGLGCSLSGVEWMIRARNKKPMRRHKSEKVSIENYGGGGAVKAKKN